MKHWQEPFFFLKIKTSSSSGAPPPSPSPSIPAAAYPSYSPQQPAHTELHICCIDTDLRLRLESHHNTSTNKSQKSLATAAALLHNDPTEGQIEQDIRTASHIPRAVIAAINSPLHRAPRSMEEQHMAGPPYRYRLRHRRLMDIAPASASDDDSGTCTSQSYLVLACGRRSMDIDAAVSFS